MSIAHANLVNISHTSAVEIHSQITLPLYLHSDSAGFASPVEEDEPGLDLNEYLVRRPAATFVARVRGDLMRGRGLFDGDLLVVDRSLHPAQGELVIAVLDGELLCRELDLRNSQLLSADDETPPLSLTDSAELRIEGVVTGLLRSLR